MRNDKDYAALAAIGVVKIDYVNTAALAATQV